MPVPAGTETRRFLEGWVKTGTTIRLAGKIGRSLRGHALDGDRVGIVH